MFKNLATIVTTLKERQRKKLPRFSVTIFLPLVIYTLVVSFIFINFRDFTASRVNARSGVVVEGILLPPTSISVAEIFNVDPLQSSSPSDAILEIRKNISFLIFSSLFKETTTGIVEQDLVKAYEFKDAKDLTITIADTLFWHDGARLTAHDVVFTLNLIKSIGQRGGFYGAINGDAIDYKAVSDTQLIITLADKDGASPNAAYLQELTFPILPKHILETYSSSQINTLSTSEFGRNPVGSGKFALGNNAVSELELKKNIRYYNTNVTFDTYVLKFYKNYDDLIKDYILKNVDIITRKDLINEDDIHRSFVDNGAHVIKGILKNRKLVLYFNLNGNTPTNMSVFDTSPTLRSTLNRYLNRKTLVEKISYFGREQYGPIDQASWAFIPEMVPGKLEDEKAQLIRRIEGLGYIRTNNYYEKNGETLHLEITLLDGEIRNLLASTIQEELSEVGIEVKLNIVSPKLGTNNGQTASTTNQFNDIVLNRNFDALLTTINQSQDPDNYNFWHSSKIAPPGLNISGLDVRSIDVPLVSGRVEALQENRLKNYQRFQRNFLQETPAIYLINPSVVIYAAPRITGINFNEINDVQYKYSSINDWRIIEKS